MSRPGPNSEQQQVFLGRLRRRRDGGAWAGRLGGSARAAHSPSAAGRATAGARSFRPRHAAAAAAFPRDSARSSRRRRRRRAPGARAPHRSLRASTYRAARGRGRREGEGARPKPYLSPLTRVSQPIRGQLRAAPTGSPAAPASACVSRPAARRTRAQAPPPSAPRRSLVRHAPLERTRPIRKSRPRPAGQSPGHASARPGYPESSGPGVGEGLPTQPQAFGRQRDIQPPRVVRLDNLAWPQLATHRLPSAFLISLKLRSGYL